MDLGEREKMYTQPKMTRNNDEKYTRNSEEDKMLEALDTRDAIRRFMEWKDKLAANKTDITGFFQGLAPDVAMELVLTAFDKKASEKTRLTAQQDILDRAGYGKVNKHAVLAKADESQSTDAIMSLMRGASKDMPDIEIVDDTEDDDTEDNY